MKGFRRVVATELSEPYGGFSYRYCRYCWLDLFFHILDNFYKINESSLENNYIHDDFFSKSSVTTDDLDERSVGDSISPIMISETD